jgi:Arc/MetJ family transcription regulator
MRTNIELNDELLTRARKYSKARTKRELVEEALETYVTVRETQLRTQTYKDRLENIRNRAAKARLRSDTRDILRSDRDSR